MAPAVGHLITFMDEKTWHDHPGEVIEVLDVSYPDLGGTSRRYITLWVLDRITRKVVRVKLSAVVSDLGPLLL
jgi:hypothetical protein